MSLSKWFLPLKLFCVIEKEKGKQNLKSCWASVFSAKLPILTSFSWEDVMVIGAGWGKEMYLWSVWRLLFNGIFHGCALKQTKMDWYIKYTYTGIYINRI